MTLLAYALIAVSALALWHFLVRSVFIPDSRILARWRLFGIRDDLRLLYIQSKDSEQPISREAFEMFNQNINGFVRVSAEIDFHFMHDCLRAIRENSELADDIEHRRAILNSCQSEQFQQLRRRYERSTAIALGINSLGDLPVILLTISLFPVVWLVVRALRLVRVCGELAFGSVVLSPFAFIRTVRGVLQGASLGGNGSGLQFAR